MRYKESIALMESDRIKIWRYEYLKKIEEYRKNGYLIFYIDQTWSITHKNVIKS